VEQGKVRWMMKISWTPLSLESPVGDDEESELGMFVEDETTPRLPVCLPGDAAGAGQRGARHAFTAGSRVLKLRFG